MKKTMLVAILSLSAIFIISLSMLGCSSLGSSATTTTSTTTTTGADATTTTSSATTTSTTSTTTTTTTSTTTSTSTTTTSTTTTTIDTDWVTVGDESFSTGMIGWTSLAIDSNGVPYIAYKSAYGNAAKVTAYTGGSWTDIGSTEGFSEGTTQYTCIAIDNDVPYVAYYDGAYENKATVQTYDSTTETWSVLGSPGFTEGSAAFLSLCVESSKAYVAFKDGANSDKLTVMRYHNSTWEVVGSAGFSTDSITATSIAGDGSGNVYVAYNDTTDNGVVQMFDGSSWTSLGSFADSDNNVYFISLYIFDGTPYVSYTDGYQYPDRKASARMYNGSNWEDVSGYSRFSDGATNHTSIFVYDNGGTVETYVAYQDFASDNKTTVMKGSNNTWEAVGSKGFSAGGAGYQSLYLYQGTPYVAFSDEGVGSGKGILKKYEP